MYAFQYKDNGRPPQGERVSAGKGLPARHPPAYRMNGHGPEKGHGLPRMPSSGANGYGPEKECHIQQPSPSEMNGYRAESLPGLPQFERVSGGKTSLPHLLFRGERLCGGKKSLECPKCPFFHSFSE